MAVRDTLRNDGHDVGQRIGLATSPPRHELHRNSKLLGQRTHVNHYHLHLQTVLSKVCVLLLRSLLAHISQPVSKFSHVPGSFRSAVTSSRSQQSILQEEALHEI